MITITVDEFKEYSDDNMGVCLACDELQSGCEPDAENYECESCGEPKVFGLEQALIIGQIDIS